VTLARFRALTWSARAGAFGLVRLPIKWMDAALPLWSLASIALFAALAAIEPNGLRLEVSALGLFLLGLRWALDLAQTALALRLHAGAPGRLAAREPRVVLTWLHALAESFTYTWLRQVLVVRAYALALTKARVWETAR
jgi:hypothetical protein